MIREFKGICGEKILIDDNSVEFAYPTKVLEQEVVYVGMKTGKKLFIDMKFKDFQYIVTKV